MNQTQPTSPAAASASSPTVNPSSSVVADTDAEPGAGEKSPRAAGSGVIIRNLPGWKCVAVLCRLGHVIDTCETRDYPKSMFEAEAARAAAGLPSMWDRRATACQGFGHDPRDGQAVA